jgi:hypothetical protein
MTKSTLDEIRNLNPVTDEEVTASLRPDDRDDLRQDLLSRAWLTEQHAPTAPTRVSQKVVRSIVRTVVPVLVAAGVMAAVAIGRPDQPIPEVPRIQVANALTFTPEGRFLVIRVVDLNADAERYNEELAARGLHIKLTLVPSSPSLVGSSTGTRIEGGEVIGDSSEPAGCLQAGTKPCVPVFRVPLDFRGTAELELGRAANPGEQYVAAGSPDANKEVLHGLRWRTKTVRDVRAMLIGRGARIAEFRVETSQGVEARATVPDDWYVNEAMPWKPGEVLLWASPPRR